MKRVKLDNAAPEVKRFVQSISVVGDGVELELNGQVVCRIMSEMSSEERAALAEEARKLIRSAQERNKSVPARVIEREIRKAVDQVRRRTK
jgi:hypothetical protein